MTADYEPNENFPQALPITPGVTVNSYICSENDTDWFKFGVTAGQVIQIDLTNLPADYDLSLFDPSGSFIILNASLSQSASKSDGP